MEFWEFLIQKEGDRSWHPIRKTARAIRSGRYRVVAQSSLKNAPVNIRVTHQTITEVPPKKRSLTRSRKTSPEGVVVIVPFTQLDAGIWEFSCAGEEMAQPSQESIQLRVSPSTPSSTLESKDLKQEIDLLNALSQEISNIESVIPVLPEPEETSLPPESTTEEVLFSELEDWSVEPDYSIDELSATNSLIEESLQDLEEMLQQAIQPLLEEDEDIYVSESESLPSPPPVLNEHWQLILHSDTFIIRRGDSIPLSGEIITTQENVEESITQARLRYELRNPQDRKLIIHGQQALNEISLPLAFSQTIYLPENCQTRLILGEIIIEAASTQDSFQVLARSPFTITFDLSEILETVLPQVSETSADPVVNKPPSLDLPALNNVPKKSTDLQPSASAIIPPKITQPNSPKKKSLQLPKLPPPQPVLPEPSKPPQPLPLEDLEQNNEDEIILSTSQLNLPDHETNLIEEPITVEPPQLSSSEPIEEAETQLAESENEIEAEDEDTENVDEEFYSLKLQKRFLDRLNVLATDTEFSEWLKEEEKIDAEPEVEETLPSESLLVDGTNDIEIIEWEESLEENATNVETPEEDFLLTDTRKELEEDDSTLIETSEESKSQSEVDSVEWEDSSAVLDEEEEFFQEESLPLPAEIDSQAEEEIEAENFLPTASEETISTDAPMQETPESLETAPTWNSLEFVVDDEEFPLQEATIPPQDTSGLPYPAEVTPPARKSPLIFSSAMANDVPTPILIIPQGELTAGEPVIVNVKLPPYSGSVFIKLWIQDRQNRSLLDGPRALVDLSPNKDGDLETLTQLTVPFGSIEIRFEAIAIDTQTQKESHKAMVDRTVVPADLPNFSFDEFE